MIIASTKYFYSNFFDNYFNSGIFLIVVLLGYGLVNIPKNLLRNSNYEF